MIYITYHAYLMEYNMGKDINLSTTEVYYDQLCIDQIYIYLKITDGLKPVGPGKPVTNQSTPISSFKGGQSKLFKMWY